MTRKIRFIHAADLHLGAPTRGLGALSDEWAERLLTAIPEAYDRVVEAAIAREVDFVIMAGDMFDSSYASYCDYLAFFEGLERLSAANIPVYLVTGNHDPYTSWARDIPRLPQSAHMLGIGVPTFELFERDGEPLCLIGGRSYYGQAWPIDERISEGITRENAIGALSAEHPDAARAPFSIGVIHTGLQIDMSKAAVDEAELLAQDIDYWACGHIHKRFVRPAPENPRIVFPGCVQGRDIKESGERGCYLVEMEEGAAPKVEFIPTASVVFHTVNVDVSDCRTLSDVESCVKKALFRENGHDYCSEMIARVNLVGNTDLHGFLRTDEVIAGVRRHVNDACPGFFCDAVVDGTRPAGGNSPDEPASSRASVLKRASWQTENEGALIDYIQSTLVQRGIAIPDALARRIADFREAAKTLACDLVCDEEAASGLPSALSEVDRRIAEREDRGGKNPGKSIFSLGDQLESRFADVRKASDAMAVLRQDDRDARELKCGRTGRAERIGSLDDDLEELREWREELKAIDKGIAEHRAEMARIHDDAAHVELSLEGPPAIEPRLLELSMQDERALRDKLEERTIERERVTRAVEQAKERSDSSRAAYEALEELDGGDARSARKLANRSVQIVVSVLFPIAFIVAGIPLFVHGRQINSLSFTAFGISLVIMAFFLAAAALIVMFRPASSAAAGETRKQDAQWVMLQDQKLLDARITEKEQFDTELNAFLASHGLGAADGSVRQALMLLDDAREERARIAEQHQREMALEIREASASAALSELESRRRDVECAAGLDEDAPVRSVEAIIRAKSAERDELRETLDADESRLASIARKLERAERDRSFDRLKLDYQQIRARLRIAKHDYIVLLLARKLLEGDES